MFVANNIGIIADDMTGANDTALQFHKSGCNTQIILDLNADIVNRDMVQCIAISTETRNCPSMEAYDTVRSATTYLKNNNIDYFYKKIDSTLRGNIARETLAMLESLDWDAAIIVPAFPAEGRITIGGYQLLRGVPLERTELALDPTSPIYESHIPTVLQHQLTDEEKNLIGLIELKTVISGAAPILLKLNQLIKEGKKLIVIDAASTTDIEQTILATEKSNYNILHTGAAALAQGLAKTWLADNKNQFIPKTIPDSPKLIISGSATQLTASQINKLQEFDDFDNAYFISLTENDVLNGVSDEMVDRTLKNLSKSNIVTVYSSNIALDNVEIDDALLDKGITKERFLAKITSYLAELTKKVAEKQEFILITLGGETSFKCAHSLNCDVLQIIDAVAPAMPLCMDFNGQWIVTKSGNLGNSMTLVDILKYFETHRQINSLNSKPWI